MVYVDYRGIGGKVYVGSARVYNACVALLECTLEEFMGPVGYKIVDVW